MTLFTVERTYLVPIFQHVTVEADSLEAAKAQALAHDSWDSAKMDYDSSHEAEVTGVWRGETAYVGDNLNAVA